MKLSIEQVDKLLADRHSVSDFINQAPPNRDGQYRLLWAKHEAVQRNMMDLKGVVRGIIFTLSALDLELKNQHVLNQAIEEFKPDWSEYELGVAVGLDMAKHHCSESDGKGAKP